MVLELTNQKLINEFIIGIESIEMRLLTIEINLIGKKNEVFASVKIEELSTIDEELIKIDKLIEAEFIKIDRYFNKTNENFTKRNELKNIQEEFSKINKLNTRIEENK